MTHPLGACSKCNRIGDDSVSQHHLRPEDVSSIDVLCWSKPVRRVCSQTIKATLPLGTSSNDILNTLANRQLSANGSPLENVLTPLHSAFKNLVDMDLGLFKTDMNSRDTLY